MYDITDEHYLGDAAVLPIQDLHPAVEVRIDIEETGVKPFIVPRLDFSKGSL
jgi:hypothetical protein